MRNLVFPEAVSNEAHHIAGAGKVIMMAESAGFEPTPHGFGDRQATVTTPQGTKAGEAGSWQVSNHTTSELVLHALSTNELQEPVIPRHFSQ